MVDCRQTAGGASHEMSSISNGAPSDTHLNQTSGSSEMAAMNPLPANNVRASTPATSVVAAYSGVPYPPGMVNPAGYPAPGYLCGMKPVMWCHGGSPPPPPPHNVNPNAPKSVQTSGSDLPLNDIPTLRFYFNLGVDCMWAAYSGTPHPRPYLPRDLVQDMQQMGLQERPPPVEGPRRVPDHKHKPHTQRALLGPRFKRGNNQDGGQGSNHNQNKNNHHNNNNHHTNNNNMGNKGPNNRAGRSTETNEAPLVYVPYPQPLYQLPYYPVDTDPGMMGMMGGMGYVGYDDGLEYAPPIQYYGPAPHYGPPHQLPPHHAAAQLAPVPHTQAPHAPAPLPPTPHAAPPHAQQHDHN